MNLVVRDCLFPLNEVSVMGQSALPKRLQRVQNNTSRHSKLESLADLLPRISSKKEILLHRERRCSDMYKIDAPPEIETVEPEMDIVQIIAYWRFALANPPVSWEDDLLIQHIAEADYTAFNRRLHQLCKVSEPQSFCTTKQLFFSRRHLAK